MHIPDIAGVVIARDDDERVAIDAIDVLPRGQVLVPEAKRREVSRAHDDVRLELVNLADRALEEARLEVRLAAVKVGELGDPEHERKSTTDPSMSEAVGTLVQVREERPVFQAYCGTDPPRFANRIEVEVTESVFLGDAAGALEILQRLRALGLGIALDDFGTGYSSLGYLNKAVFHKLKIDGSFVRDAGKSPETVAIIQSIVALAKSFRMTVTAEGVETSDDFTRMRDLGCHQIQGYLFGRPMSFEDASALVQGRKAKKLSA